MGAVSSGKTALAQALLGLTGDILKTQAAEFHHNNVIDTPGEFVGRRNYYNALLATIVDVPTILYVQAANTTFFAMPAGLLSVYPDKRIVGVITKIDLPDADIDAACQVLQDNGIAEPYFATSAKTGFGLPTLRRYLLELGNDSMRDARAVDQRRRQGYEGNAA
ncbi:MAG: hypothetical protein KDI33_16715 [Halioglobus sp.]|nr:hypothetical protein [Halioglobus sp.]